MPLSGSDDTLHYRYDWCAATGVMGPIRTGGSLKNRAVRTTYND